MQNTELQQIQKTIRFEAPSMAAALGIPYNHYRHMYYGHQTIPVVIAEKARELERIDRAWMAGFTQRLNSKIAREFPFGIVSEVA